MVSRRGAEPRRKPFYHRGTKYPVNDFSGFDLCVLGASVVKSSDAGAPIRGFLGGSASLREPHPGTACLCLGPPAKAPRGPYLPAWFPSSSCSWCCSWLSCPSG